MIYIGTADISSLSEDGYQMLYHRACAQRQKKADRYLRKSDAHRCIVADGLLRFAMRQALGTDQAEILRTPRGKPFLPDQDGFHFNLSHSGRWVVIGWGDGPVGIDVETIEPVDSKEPLIRRFFRSDEQDYVFAVEGQDRAQRFYEIWTRKESYLKYLGTGIDRALDSFSVLQPVEAAFHTCLLPDAIITLCAPDPKCQIFPVTLDQLLSG